MPAQGRQRYVHGDQNSLPCSMQQYLEQSSQDASHVTPQKLHSGCWRLVVPQPLASESSPSLPSLPSSHLMAAIAANDTSLPPSKPSKVKAPVAPKNDMATQAEKAEGSMQTK